MFRHASELPKCKQVNIAAMRVACSIHGLRPPVRGTPKTLAALVPGTGELALSGEGAVLQIFDASRNRHIDKVQVQPLWGLIWVTGVSSMSLTMLDYSH